VLYLSRFILERKSDYYLGLRGVTERGLWEQWILYMLEAIEITARHTESRIRAIRGLMTNGSSVFAVNAHRYTRAS
jgi:Fic family protein